MTQRFALDPSYRRPEGGSVVIGGSPLRLFRLGAGGMRVAEALETGRPLPRGHDPLTARFVDAGVVHPVPDLVDHDPALLTVVIPSGPGEVPRCIETGGRCRVIVVDDGAQPPLELLRQGIKYGGWYDLKDLSFRTNEDCQFVGAMGPPGGGRTRISNRYARHFNVLSFVPFDDASLAEIRRYGAERDVAIELGSWSICPTAARFKKDWGTADEHLALLLREG